MNSPHTICICGHQRQLHQKLACGQAGSCHACAQEATNPGCPAFRRRAHQPPELMQKRHHAPHGEKPRGVVIR